MSCYSDTVYINELDARHDNVQSYYYVNGVVDSLHVNSAEDRRWKWRYCRPSDSSNTFESPSILTKTSFDATWDRDCTTLNLRSAFIGATSEHLNYYEDREWYMYCSLFPTQYYFGSCYDTGYINNYDSAFTFYCPNDGIIRGIYSTHENYYDDRRFGFHCCNVYNTPTASPTLDPTQTPTHSPSLNPTAVPSKNPIPSPTTSSPSTPDTLTCGESDTGAYNDVAIEFKVRLSFEGDITFDASRSDFTVSSLSAKPFGGQVIAADSDGDGVLVVHDVTVLGDYIFTLAAADGVTGVYMVSIMCESDYPTMRPTMGPSESPSGQPTRNPAQAIVVRVDEDSFESSTEDEEEIGGSNEGIDEDVEEGEQDGKQAGDSGAGKVESNNARDVVLVVCAIAALVVVFIVLFYVWRRSGTPVFGDTTITENSHEGLANVEDVQGEGDTTVEENGVVHNKRPGENVVVMAAMAGDDDDLVNWVNEHGPTDGDIEVMQVVEGKPTDGDINAEFDKDNSESDSAQQETLLHM